MKRVIYILLYIILIITIFFGLSDRIIYGQQQDLLRWLPFILLFVVNPILVFLIARTFEIKKNTVIGIAALSVLVWGPLYGIYLNKMKDKELTLHGKPTMGIVYKKWHTSGRNRHEWLLKCRFYVNGVEYSTFSEEDKYNQYKIGDTLHVVYAERTPTNCEILELK